MEPLDVRDVDERSAESASTPTGDRAGRLAFAAHEARNPLATALWTAELLARMQQAERGGPRGEKLAGMCLRAVQRVRQIIEDYFLSERLDAGGFALRKEPVSLAEAIGAVVERKVAGSSAVTVTVDPALAVQADRVLLERVLEALIAAAAAESTPVAVGAESEEGAICITVSGRPADPAALADPVKGAPSDPTGRALSLPLARRIASVLGLTLAAAGGIWRLAFPSVLVYTSRPAPAASP